MTTRPSQVGLLAAALLVSAFCASASAQVPTSACPKPNGSNTTAACPKISGSLQEAAFASGTPGEWTGSGPIAIGLQWQRCTSFEATTCADIPGENEASYLIASADVGNRLRLVVTASNSEGSDSRTSVVSSPVVAGPSGFPGYNQSFSASLEALSPANLSAPLVGDTLRIADGPGSPATSDGWFNPKPNSYAYAWRRCAADGALASCETIAGATARSYTLTVADGGHAIRARLTGTNASGSKALLTAASSPIGYPDRDGDGYTLDRDCNDGNAAIRPGASDAPGNGVDEDCSGADAIGPVNLRPVLSALSLTPAAFRAASSGPTVSAVGGTKVTYRLSEAATVKFSVERAVPGERQGRRCVKPSASLPATAKRCTRYLAKGSFSDRGSAGANSLRFSGRLGAKALAPGRYRLSAEARDAAGTRSAKPATAAFRILPAAKSR